MKVEMAAMKTEVDRCQNPDNTCKRKALSMVLTLVGTIRM
jgi:hypothetical protein